MEWATMSKRNGLAGVTLYLQKTCGTMYEGLQRDGTFIEASAPVVTELECGCPCTQRVAPVFDEGIRETFHAHRAHDITVRSNLHGHADD